MGGTEPRDSVRHSMPHGGNQRQDKTASEVVREPGYALGPPLIFVNHNQANGRFFLLLKMNAHKSLWEVL